MKSLWCVFLLFSVSSFASITIDKPANGAVVASPFSLSASASSCLSQPVRSMGYSLDNSHETTILHSPSLDVVVASSPGLHKVHIKAWNVDGGVCAAEVSVTVSEASENTTEESALVPANATASSNLERSNNWFAAHDTSGSGQSSGGTQMVNSPSRSGSSREFTTSYVSAGDERYSVFFGNDPKATNFFYDAWIYLTDSSRNISNLELDVNQTMSNRQTVIFGVQCNGYSNTWDYSENFGTPSQPKGNWAHSSAKCNVRKWSMNQWHHVQMSYSRDDDGNITYKSIYLDGTESPINATVLGARALGWHPNLSTNFQVDGQGPSGTSTVYLDELTIYHW